MAACPFSRAAVFSREPAYVAEIAHLCTDGREQHQDPLIDRINEHDALPFLLFNGQLFGVIDTHLWGTVLIWIASILTIWSMIYYMQKALPEIRARVK